MNLREKLAQRREKISGEVSENLEDVSGTLDLLEVGLNQALEGVKDAQIELEVLKGEMKGVEGKHKVLEATLEDRLLDDLDELGNDIKNAANDLTGAKEVKNLLEGTKGFVEDTKGMVNDFKDKVAEVDINFDTIGKKYDALIEKAKE